MRTTRSSKSSRDSASLSEARDGVTSVPSTLLGTLANPVLFPAPDPEAYDEPDELDADPEADAPDPEGALPNANDLENGSRSILDLLNAALAPSPAIVNRLFNLLTTSPSPSSPSTPSPSCTRFLFPNPLPRFSPLAKSLLLSRSFGACCTFLNLTFLTSVKNAAILSPES